MKPKSRFTLTWLFSIAAACACMGMPGLASGGAEAIRLREIVVEPVQCRPNLLPNPSFEEVDSTAIPAGWRWDRRNTDAACLIDRTNAHRGRQSLLITNGTAFGAHVYGMLWLAQPIRLSEGKPCTMSAWVKSDAPGVLSLIGGSDWQFRAQAARTDGHWQRIWKSFTPGATDTDFTLRISTESPTPGVWIDDLKLEEGTVPTAEPLKEDDKVLLEAEEAQTVVQGDGPFSVAFTLSNSRAVAGALSAGLGTGEPLRQTISLATGVWRVLVKGESAAADNAPRALTLRLEEANKESTTASEPVRFFSAGDALQRLDALKTRLTALRVDLQTVRLRGQDTSYPAVTATVLGNFIGYAEEDAGRGEVRRSLEQVGDLERMAARLGGELNEALAGRRQFPAVPRWTGEKRPVVRSSSFVAPARLPGGAPQERPVFFTGYGHFAQVVSDMEKWPQLRRHREGFLQYCLHATEGRELLRRFILTALEVTALQQTPAQALLLQSVTASVWDGGGYGDCLQKLYTALSFTGLKLGFVTERQLETGFVPQAPVVFVPGIVHLSGAAFAGLRQFKGRVVLVGGADVLARDEYGRERSPELPAAEKLPFRHGSTSSRNLHEQVLARLSAWHLRPRLELREAGQQSAWGVEWRSTETREGTVANLCNYRKEPVAAVLVRDGRPVAAEAVLSGRRVDTPFTIAPLDVRLLKLR
jgi:hypothetical protein